MVAKDLGQGHAQETGKGQGQRIDTDLGLILGTGRDLHRKKGKLFKEISNCISAL